MRCCGRTSVREREKKKSVNAWPMSATWEVESEVSWLVLDSNRLYIVRVNITCTTREHELNVLRAGDMYTKMMVLGWLDKPNAKKANTLNKWTNSPLQSRALTSTSFYSFSRSFVRSECCKAFLFSVEIHFYVKCKSEWQPGTPTPVPSPQTQARARGDLKLTSCR